MITRSAFRIDAFPAGYARLAFWLLLAVAEMLVVSIFYDYTPPPGQQSPAFYVTRLARAAAVGLPIFLVLTWSRRRELAEQWSAMQSQSRSLAGWPLAINLAIFALTAVTAASVTIQAAKASSPPWLLMSLLGVLLAAMTLSLVRIISPFRALGGLVLGWHRELALASAAALAVVLLADAATQLWESMASATLLFSAEILKLYETGVVVDLVERGIRVGDFGVLILPNCSGFEGLALVAGFLTVYLWAFRNELSFPKALILFPIGLAASWLLNSIRIAALVSIGAHFSPDMAVRGFHSQAGWIAFLAVALGLMALSQRFIRKTTVQQPKNTGALAAPSSATSGLPTRYDATVTHLVPFIALMVGSIAMSASAPHDRPVYVLKAGLVAVALWFLRHRLGSWRPALPGISTLAGVLVAVTWVATSPTGPIESDLGTWLAEIGPAMAIAWLVIRGAGTIVLVPIAEELAFRGYLYRRLIGRDFHLVGWKAFSWVALIVSSVAFGVLHDRWLAGTLAGVVFALLMLRGGRLGDAILAHGVANALIFIWALAFQQWSLLQRYFSGS